MAEPSDDLERLSREQLILKARVLGVDRAELMTRVELRDEIVRRSEPDPVQQKRARGFLGVARDLVASVVEAGLNLPDAAAIIRGDGSREDWKGPPPVATVTLAEIYATQGHLERALRMLDEVIEKEPDHEPARALRDRLAASEGASASPRKRLKLNLAEPAPETPVPDALASEGSETPQTEPELEFRAPESAPVELVTKEPEAIAPPPVEHGHAEPDTVDAAAEEIVSAHVEAPPARPQEPFLLTVAFGGRRQVYWEMPEAAWQPLRARAPEGRAVLRVICFKTNAGKVERSSFDLTPHAEVGASILPGLGAQAVVRAALGWEESGRFTPFVLAADLGNDLRPSAKAPRFRPHALVGSASAEAEARALAHLKQIG